MPGIPITDIVLGSATAISAAFAAFSYWTTRHDKHKQSLNDRIKSHLAPLETRVHHVEQGQRDLPDTMMQRMEGVIGKAIEPLRDDISIINTKIEPLWMILLAIAKDQADILHHPDPDRAELDTLLEHFKEEILTSDEELTLRRYLYKIKNYTEGQDIGFKVYPNEPTNAGILLRTMELVKYWKPRGAKK